MNYTQWTSVCTGKYYAIQIKNIDTDLNNFDIKAIFHRE